MSKKLKKITEEIIFVFNEQKLLILQQLYECKDEVCGCDLIDKIGITKDLLSYHIRSLREREYIEEVKCGQRKKYSITKAKLPLVREILKTARLI